MGRIYTYPKEVGAPPNWRDSINDYKKHVEAENTWLESLKAWCVKNNPKCEEAGRIISEPVADGSALYMVLSIKPVKLIHIPLGDAWEFRWAPRWTTKDIKQMVAARESMGKLIEKHLASKEGSNNDSIQK
jgi:hypothetical protein